MKVVRLGEGTRIDLGRRYGKDMEGVEVEWLIHEGDMALRYFRARPHSHIPEHSHPWEHVIIVARGRMNVRVDGERRDVGEGDHLHVPSGSVHEYWISDEGCEFYCIINCIGDNCTP